MGSDCISSWSLLIVLLCSASEAILKSLECLDIASRGIILSRQQTTLVLIRLHVCAG